MSAHFLEKNESYAKSFDEGGLPMPPSKKLMIITCMDSRIEAHASLGLKLGEAHVLRNAGGCARAALRDIVISQRMLGTREIAVFHHTRCGMLTFTSPQLRDKVKQEADAKDAAGVSQTVDNMDFLEFSDVEASVKDDVKFLQENPLVLKDSRITGWTYDLDTGKVEQVV